VQTSLLYKWRRIFFAGVFSDSLEQTKRGFDADLIIIDEANFIKRQLWTDLILPLNMQEKTALVAASSPKGAANSYCSRLIAAKDEDGEPIFNTIRASESCKACLAAGVSETCNHKTLARSKNKSSRKMKATAALYQDGDYDTMMEEMYGLESSSKGGIIPDSAVQSFRENVKTLTHRPRCVYISIDPGGGGKGSQMGVIVAAELNTAASGVKLIVSGLLLCFCLLCWHSLGLGWLLEANTRLRQCTPRGHGIPWPCQVS
jgi:hypothetical protein